MDSAERRAEIIPIERIDFFQIPDPGNTGVGKSIQSQVFLLIYSGISVYSKHIYDAARLLD